MDMKIHRPTILARGHLSQVYHTEDGEYREKYCAVGWLGHELLGLTCEQLEDMSTGRVIQLLSEKTDMEYNDLHNLYNENDEAYYDTDRLAVFKQFCEEHNIKFID